MAHTFLGHYGGKVSTMETVKLIYVAAKWDEIEFFNPDTTDANLRCQHCGNVHMDHFFMCSMDDTRRILGFPLGVNSGYRCKQYDQNIGGANVHPTGHALDSPIAGDRAYELIQYAVSPESPFTGIGIYQKGPWDKRYVHLDDLPPGIPNHPRPRIWTY